MAMGGRQGAPPLPSRPPSRAAEALGAVVGLLPPGVGAHRDDGVGVECGVAACVVCVFVGVCVCEGGRGAQSLGGALASALPRPHPPAPAHHQPTHPRPTHQQRTHLVK